MTDIDTANIRASLDARGTIGPLRTYDLCDALDAARAERDELRANLVGTRAATWRTRAEAAEAHLEMLQAKGLAYAEAYNRADELLGVQNERLMAAEARVGELTGEVNMHKHSLQEQSARIAAALARCDSHGLRDYGRIDDIRRALDGGTP